MENGMLYIAVLAGGNGTRLWPLSTQTRPKQFCVLSGGRSLLQVTVDRLSGLIPPESIYILTPTPYFDLARQQLRELPDDCFLVEPGGCGTSGALGIAAAVAMRRDPEAVIVSLAADLFFGQEEMLRKALRLGESLAQRGEFVTLAVPPAWPETGYGYIETAKNWKGILTA